MHDKHIRSTEENFTVVIVSEVHCMVADNRVFCVGTRKGHIFSK